MVTGEHCEDFDEKEPLQDWIVEYRKSNPAPLVDRLGRSLKDLVAFLSELHALGIDCFCISRVSIRPRRPARRCFRCWASLPSSSARSFKSACALAYSGPSVKVNDLAGRRSRTSWLSESEQLWRAA